MFTQHCLLCIIYCTIHSATILRRQKLQLYNSRLNKYRSSGTQCVVTLFKVNVISRENVEYQFARFQNTVCNFVERWNTYNVLGNVENNNIIFNL